MPRTYSPRLALSLLVRRAAARRAAGLASPSSRNAVALATAALSLAASGPALAQGPTPAGAEFQVNTFTAGSQYLPSVASDSDGDFVVAWQSSNQDGSSYGVYAQRYTAAGAPAGGEFRVNTFTQGSQAQPSVAMDADGDFVVAWTSIGQDGSYHGVYARRYAASGTPAGAEFRVNTFTQGYQWYPSVAMDGDGDFVVAWQSEYQDGSRHGVYAQRYTAAGAPAGGEFRVNTFTTDNQRLPSVGMDADGDFVVAWESDGQDGSGFGVYARRYAASGAPAGGEFRVNTFTTDSQQLPSVGMDADGDFVVTWTGKGTGDYSGVFAQRHRGGSVAGEPDAPGSLSLALAPNPIGPTGGTVRFDLPKPAHVRLALFDVLGREVAVLADGERSPGTHDVALNASCLAPCVYVVRLAASETSVVRRVTAAR